MRKIKLYILFIITVLILNGCTAPKNEAVKFEKKDKAPNTLGDIGTGLQDIMVQTEKIESVLDGTDMEVQKVEMEKAKEEEKAKETRTIEIKGDAQSAAGEQGSGGNQGQGGGQGGSQSSQSSGGDEGGHDQQKPPEGKDEKLLSLWEQIESTIETVHNQWNEHEAEAIKKGITPDNTEKFKTSLNNLTKSIENRRVAGIYDHCSQSMGNLAPMFEIYKDEVGGEINRIKNFTYQAYLRSLQGKEAEASTVLDKSEEEINKIRLKLEKDDSKIKILDNVRLSIEDMKKALNQKSIKLTRIKKDIIIKNLEELGK